MAINEEDMHRVVYVKDRFEGGFSSVYCPEANSFSYQVFIHSEFPLQTFEEWNFPTFSEARHFAARHFSSEGWELLAWDNQVKRPCSDGGAECGSGSCEMCKSTGGGCKSCGAQDSQFGA